MNRSFYSDSIANFLSANDEQILGVLVKNCSFSVESTQKMAWQHQIEILKQSILKYEGQVIFEYTIPRMGKRIDVLLIIQHVIFVIEFKVGESTYNKWAVDQVWDYALDLKYFHETSRNKHIVPILVATRGHKVHFIPQLSIHQDKVFNPILANSEQLTELIDFALGKTSDESIESRNWEHGRYSPTPTIIEAAVSLYSNHSVSEISRNDAGATNLTETSDAVSQIIENARHNKHKAICFVTGVPGAGKTLVGLNISTKNLGEATEFSSVFLSGNGSLVAVLREALTRNRFQREKEAGTKITKGEIARSVKLFIQNVHHFRDDCLHSNEPPHDHVAIFDEAQRAWNHGQTAKFMAQKKGKAGFLHSEPEFLISCLDRHQDWAVIVCLVGGGQEINTGEAGIGEWLESLNRTFPHWNVHISSGLLDHEYAAGDALDLLKNRNNVHYSEKLHLAVSMRSFRAEHLSLMVKHMLDLKPKEAKAEFQKIGENYPVVITRDLEKARKWLRGKARGSERYGIVVSSQAQRLKPYAIDVKSPIDPIHWFLNEKDDIRSSYFLEDVATEFHVQGLELDWTCVTWDADLRYTSQEWTSFSFKGNKWERIIKVERKQYLKNAYRVLLTRARQGMIIVVPNGTEEDPTRQVEWYNKTWDYLNQIGFKVI